MPTHATLPQALSTRPLRHSDSRIVFDLMAAQELHDTGKVQIEEADLISDWSRPSHDLTARSVGVFDGSALVGYAELVGADRGDTSVLPSHRGRGIGNWLAHWIQDRARRCGSPVVGMPVPQGSPGDPLLAELGWGVRWTSWVLQLPAGVLIAARQLPDGFQIRTAGTEHLRAAHDVLEDAFLEWSVRPRESFEDFEAATLGRPGFEPWNLRVLLDAHDEVRGVSVVLMADEGAMGYVDRLAVRMDSRGRGFARALLVDSFAHTRAHGATTSELNTDSRSGALGLYESVGMVVREVWVNRAIGLSGSTAPDTDQT